MTAKTTRHAHKDAVAVWLCRTSPGAAKKSKSRNGEVIHRKRCSSPRGLRIRPLDPASTGRLHRPVRTAALTNPAQGTASLVTQPKGVPPLEPRPTVRRLDAARALPLWTGQQGRAAPDNPTRFPLPGKPALATPSCVKAGKNELPEFHPQTLLRDRGNGQAFRLADALTGVCLFGATGSGTTSGSAKHRACGYPAVGPERVHGLRKGR